MSTIQNLPIKLLPHFEGLPLPERKSEGASGVDLIAAISSPVIIEPGERSIIPTGLTVDLSAITLPDSSWIAEAQIRPRSGLAATSGITVLNTPGTIDNDFRGEIGVILVNNGATPFTINRGHRIAQMVIVPVIRVQLVVQTELTDTQRGAGGFGSTGIN